MGTSNAFTGSFVVGNVGQGPYQITVTSGSASLSVYYRVIAPFIQLSDPLSVGQPGKGPIGTHVSIEGSYFSLSDTTCSVYGPTNGNLIVNGACAFFAGTGIFTGYDNVTGSFDVGNVPEGQYVIQVTGSQGDYAQAIFNVTAGAFIQLSGASGGFARVGQPATGPIGTHVSIEGSQFLSDDAFSGYTCSISSPTNGAIVVSGACSFFKTTNGWVNATGSFIVGNVPEGQYVITVYGSAGDSAQAIFSVTGGAVIQLSGVSGGFVSVGHVASGPVGTHVNIEGSQFLSNDAFSGYTCSISSPTSGTIIVNGACSFFTTSSGLVNATGSFVVGNVPEGQYVIEVYGSAGDSAQALFNVTAGAFIQLSGVSGGFVSVGHVASGPVGTHVNIEGSQFLADDAFSGYTCSISSPTSGTIISNGACSFFKTTKGWVNATGSFIVGNVPEGQYVITVYGSAGDSAQAIFSVTAGAFIQLSGVSGGFASVGHVASGPIGTHVNIEGSQFLADDAFTGYTCSISSPTSGTIINNGACSFSTTTSGIVNATGSFVVGNVPEGQYVIEVYGSAGDSAQALFNVTAGAFIQLSVSGVSGGFVKVGQVASGPIGTHVSIEGSQFLANDAFNGYTCSISSPTNGVIVVSGACSFFKTTNGWVNATGSFTVGNVLPGQYVIEVYGSAGDSAQAMFAVTVGPTLTLSPGSGRIGTDVIVNGTGFLPTDGTCTIYGPSSSIVTAAACSMRLGTGNPSGSFTVGNVAPGQYVIQVTGNQGDYAQFVFKVTIGPTISLSPASGRIGIHVLMNGTGFLPTDNTCTISSSTSGFITVGACSLVFGSGAPGGSFTVGNVLPGQYVVQVTGSPGSDFAQMVLNVTVGATFSLTPTTSPPGHGVTFSGTGFLPTDTTCTITSPTANVVESGSAACVTRAGTGAVSGSFITGNVLPGQYIVQITGNGGDFAQEALNVTGGPILGLSPGTGAIGASIFVNGTGFLTTDQSCSISSTSSPNPILSGSSACVVTVGTGKMRGSITIGSAPAGEYVIELTGCAGNNGCSPSVGDFAQSILTVVSGPASLTLSPSSSVEESTVTFIGTGLSASDTGCTLVAYNTETSPPAVDNNLITSPTCSITTSGVAQGSFVVSPYATADTPWSLIVKGTPVLDQTPFAAFTVTPDVIVTPTSGTVNTVFTFTGSGFSSQATTCTATVIPSFTTTTTTTAPGCAMSANIGQVSGSVVVPAGAQQGTYGISVTDNTGKTAEGTFTVGTPSALVVLNPASVGQGQPVGVAGTGFNPSDTYCTISSSSGTALFASTPTCLISSGYVSGSFTVSNTAVGGYYLISATACSVAPSANVCPAGDALDFASNFLSVTLTTTVTTYSTTTTSSTSTTSLSTTTTSVATSFSYVSTTYSTTGIFFTSYTQFLVTTVSGLTTTTYSQTSVTTQTQTTVTFSTTTSFTTVPCGPLPCGLTIQPASMNPAPGIDSVGLLAALLLLLPALLRRLFT
jgi:hypothetical protein